MAEPEKNKVTDDSLRSHKPAFGNLAWALLIIAGSALLAVTRDSLWIDEAVTAELAKQATLADCWNAMGRLPEVQLPLYMLYMWAYVHVIGSGEWIMRAAALPWFIIGAAVFVRALARASGAMLVPALLVSWSAFAWYYLNEARVYGVQLGLAMAVIGSALNVLMAASIAGRTRSHWRIFLLSLLLFCGTSILGALWGFCFFVAFLFLIPRSRWIEPWRMAPWTALACAAGLAALAAYYAWTMTLKARPTAIATTTPQTIIFVFYELLGYAGWGPGRNDLRVQGAGALVPFLVPLCLFAVVSAIVFWNGFKELARFTARRLALIMAWVCVPFALICIMGVLTHFRVLGRHATSLLPFVLLVMTFGIVRLSRDRKFGRAIAGIFLLLLLGSCLLIRFSHRHEKDDYRGAAAIARDAAAAGKRVWWNADQFSADYYDVTKQDRVRIIFSPTLEALRNQPEPDVVVVSKPDVYDLAGGVAAYVREKGYRISARLPAFVIWVKET